MNRITGLILALAVGVMDRGGPTTPEERARNLGASISCPVCDGQSVADSDAAPARNIRVFISDQIDEGRSDEEIRSAVDSRFPESLLLTPERSGAGALVWVLPVVVLVLAFTGVGYAFYRWRQMPGARRASRSDRALVGSALRAESARGRDGVDNSGSVGGRVSSDDPGDPDHLDSVGDED